MVFFVTSFWSLWGYIWLYLIVTRISPYVIELWEVRTAHLYPLTLRRHRAHALFVTVSAQALILVLCFPLMVITAWLTDTGRSVWVPVLQERLERFQGLWHRHVRSSSGRWLPHARHLDLLDDETRVCTCPPIAVAAFQLSPSPPDADGRAIASARDHQPATTEAIEMSPSPPVPETVADEPIVVPQTSVLSPVATAIAMERSPNLDVIEEDAVLEIEVINGGGVGVENIAYNATNETDTEAPLPAIEIAQGEQVQI